MNPDYLFTYFLIPGGLLVIEIHSCDLLTNVDTTASVDENKNGNVNGAP
jgi:hypothetical protein